MKLFLASATDKSMDLLNKRVAGSLMGKKVLFIPNASDNEVGEAEWVTDEQTAFEKYGCTVNKVDLRSLSKEELNKNLEESDIIHFCGGSVLYLISLIQEQGFQENIVDFVKNNKIIYSGSSAGSMITAQDLTLSTFDIEEQKFVDKTKSYRGLGLVNFFIIPHSNERELVESNKQMVEKFPKHQQPVIFLYDTQALWVEDNTVHIDFTQ